MFLSAIMSLLSSSAVGSALGGFFAWLNKKNDLAVLQMQLADKDKDRAHDLALRDKDLAQVQAEITGKKDVAITEGDASVDAARMAAIAGVQAADVLTADEIKAAGWWGWALTLADAAKRMMRPLLTVLLVAMALLEVWLFVEAFMSDGWKALPVDQKKDSAMLALAWVTGQASIVISYWFVSRGSARAPASA